MNLETYITESISGKKKISRMYYPQHGCDIEELVGWLKNNGVDRFIEYKAPIDVDRILKETNVGEFICIIGPELKDNSHRWVKLTYGINNFARQSVVFRPYISYSTVELLDRSGYFKRTAKDVTFEDAIEIAEKLFSRPKTPVNVK